MSKKDNIISLITFREKKQTLMQTKKKVSNAPVFTETKKSIDKVQKNDNIVLFPTPERVNRSYTNKGQEKDNMPRDRKSQSLKHFWRPLANQAMSVATLTAVMLLALNIFMPQKQRFSTGQRGLASQTLTDSQNLSPTKFVKNLNKTFKNRPTPPLERDLDSLSSPGQKPSFFQGTLPESPDYKGF